jgi:hypothetical protein
MISIIDKKEERKTHPQLMRTSPDVSDPLRNAREPITSKEFNKHASRDELESMLECHLMTRGYRCVLVCLSKTCRTINQD